MSILATAAPRLHDGVPGILGLVAVGLMLAVAGLVRLKRGARRTLARYQPTQLPPEVVAHVLPQGDEDL